MGNTEALKGTILYILQLAEKEEYKSDRTASWTTRNWINAVIQWYRTFSDVALKLCEGNEEQVFTIIDDLYFRDFLKIEQRAWKKDTVNTYSLTEDGQNYASKVYLPIIREEYDITNEIQKHYDFLIHLKPNEIYQNIQETKDLKEWKHDL